MERCQAALVMAVFFFFYLNVYYKGGWLTDPCELLMVMIIVTAY